MKRAKQFFRAAVRKKLIPENSFADLPAPEQVNNAREYFVTTKTVVASSAGANAQSDRSPAAAGSPASEGKPHLQRQQKWTRLP